jgi:hypothetical protein
MRLILAILSVILITSIILRVYTNPIHRYILKIIFIYSILAGFYWYKGVSLSFENATSFFLYICLPSIIFVVIGFVILIDLGIILSTYNGDSRLILFIKEIYDFFKVENSPERYRSIICWNLREDEEEALKFIVSFFILITLSLSVLYLPSILSSSSPRLYDIYAISGNINAEMNDEYPVDELIYVPVEVGGLDTGLSLTLSKYNSGKFEEISSLVLYPNELDTQVNNSLSGETNNSGNYKVYLDPKFMPKGDYELEFENAQNRNISSSKIFSLK